MGFLLKRPKNNGQLTKKQLLTNNTLQTVHSLDGMQGVLEEPASFYKGQKTITTPFPPLVEFLFRGSFPGTIELPTTQISRYFQSYLQTYVYRT